jgi:hypothetical protein
MTRADWNAQAAEIAEADAEMTADIKSWRKELASRRIARRALRRAKPRQSLKSRISGAGEVCAGYCVIAIFWSLSVVAKGVGAFPSARRLRR